MKRIPTTVFSEWAAIGRDESMAKGHEVAVNNMLNYALKGLDNYSFLDAGCGNGWVVRLVKAHKGCVAASGVDGAQMMIEKALSIDPAGTYCHADLANWAPNEKVDVVHSMEVVYYLSDPKAFIANAYKNWLNKNGRFIVGLDFYKENTVSHSWPEDCGVSIMQLLPELTWIGFFKEAGFSDVQSWRVDEKENWAGTLVLTGVK
jgi:predicted TPR repeat methyltransferase